MSKPAANLKRPGGALANRPLMFYWIVDRSGSMGGEKISTLNHAASSVIPEMITEAAENPNAQVMMNVLSFASGAEWVAQNVPLEDFIRMCIKMNRSHSLDLIDSYGEEENDE